MLFNLHFRRSAAALLLWGSALVLCSCGASAPQPPSPAGASDAIPQQGTSTATPVTVGSANDQTQAGTVSPSTGAGTGSATNPVSTTNTSPAASTANTGTVVAAPSVAVAGTSNGIVPAAAGYTVRCQSKSAGVASADVLCGVYDPSGLFQSISATGQQCAYVAGTGLDNGRSVTIGMTIFDPANAVDIKFTGVNAQDLTSLMQAVTIVATVNGVKVQSPVPPL